MAPKRRSTSKVVSSVVKTKVVQETVEVITTAIVDDDAPDQQAAAKVVEELPAGVNVSGSSTVVRVEVTTPDGDTGAADVDVKQQPKKRLRRPNRRHSPSPCRLASLVRLGGETGEKMSDAVAT
jgi:hypothetical protein